MILNLVLGCTWLVISSAVASPLPFGKNVFADFFVNDPTKERDVMKRGTSEENSDRELSQISLSSLVGDLEKNIFSSALSLNKLFTDNNVTVPEIKVNNQSHDDANKTQLLTQVEDNKETTNSTAIKRETTISLPSNDTVILQTTEKAPQTADAPTHIIIDRIAIEPHVGGVAPIPVFDLEHATNSKNEHVATKITISKTQITNLATATLNPPTTTVSSSTTTIAEDTTVTTPKSIGQLKEAEEELKEKLAEIEAEPVILSARV